MVKYGLSCDVIAGSNKKCRFIYIISKKTAKHQRCFAGYRCRVLTFASSSNPLYLFLLLFLFCFLLPAYFPHLFPPSGDKVVWLLQRFLRQSTGSTKPSPAGRASSSDWPVAAGSPSAAVRGRDLFSKLFMFHLKRPPALPHQL